MTNDAEYDAIIVGAGFAGLYMLHRLRDGLGLNVRVLEAADGVGGTWHLNRYPGARCDSEAYVYCYSFDRELWESWEWSGKYPTQPELLAYLNHVADRLNLRSDISLETRVQAAAFDDSSSTWTVSLDDGTALTSRYFITGVGLLASAPYLPDYAGLDDFTGEWHHTGDWPREGVDFSGKRVAIIGTGSTGVQSIPVIAQSAAHLTVYQRTPQFTVPARHGAMTSADLRDIRENRYEEIWKVAKWSAGGFPWAHNGRSGIEDGLAERAQTFEQLWQEGGFRFIFGSYRDLLTDRRVNDYASEFVRSKIRGRLTDDSVRELLVPRDHPFGSKRPIVDTNYFEAYNLEHVELVDLQTDPIVGMTCDGIETLSGLRDFDVIVFATGFDAVTGPFLRMDISGLGGVKLSDTWADGPSSYLGIGVHGFPNMFMITGPGSTFGNIPVVVEHHVEWIEAVIEHMRRIGAARVEPEVQAERGWTAQMADAADRTVIPLADSWGTGQNIPGKPRTVLFYLGSYGTYRKKLDEVAAAGYEGFQFRGRGSRESRSA